MATKNGTEVMLGLMQKRWESGSFVFKFTAWKVVNCSYIIRKNSFIDQKARDAVINGEDSFTGSALQTIFNLDNRVGGINGATENGDEFRFNHSVSSII